MDTMHWVEHLEARRLFAAGPLDSDGLALRDPTPAGQYALQDRKLVLSDGRTIVAGDDQSHGVCAPICPTARSTRALANAAISTSPVDSLQ
jgi:hypothetical protein